MQSQIQQTVAAARLAETTLVSTLHAVADQLDTIGLDPVQEAVERLGQAVAGVHARLGIARDNALFSLAGLLGDLASFTVGLTAPVLEPEPVALPESKSAPASQVVIVPPAPEILPVVEEQVVAIAANPPADSAPEAPLAPVKEPLTVQQAKRLPKADLVEMVQQAGGAVADPDSVTKRDLLDLLEQAGVISG